MISGFTKYFVKQKALIRTFHTSFFITKKSLGIHKARTHSKGDFILKNRFETFDLKFTGIQKKI